jgi:hypothetical protein
MFRSLLSMLVVAALILGSSGCAFFDKTLVLKGAVANLTGDRVYVASIKPIKGQIGQGVTIYQRIEVPALDRHRAPWHLIRPVATGQIAEITPQGAWVLIHSGVVAQSGEIELRTE